MPTVKIVLGGRGLNVKPHLSINQYLNEQEKRIPFHKIMRNHNLFDEIIIGDAEDAIIDLFSGQKAEDEITWHVAKSDNLQYPFANFDDYQLDKYAGVNGRPQLHVISSKGCVRRCDFCDVAFQFKKFKSKDGERMAEEIIHLSEKYNITEFATADSILNGNMKTLKVALQILAEYNGQRPEEKKIKWGGNWICRPRGRVTPDFFDLMYQGGCRHLNVGAEHGSDAVLEAMDKKTNVDGLLYEIEQMHRTGIQCGLNNIVGHWSEKYEDWVDHLNMFVQLGPYFANRTITQLMLGFGFAVLGDTPVLWNSHENGVEAEDDNFSMVWYTHKNANLTFKTRIARLVNMYRFVLGHKIPVIAPYQMLLGARNRYKESISTGNKFIKKRLPKEKYKKCRSVELLHAKDKFDDMMSKTIRERYTTTTLKLTVESHEAKGMPGIIINANGKQYKKLLPMGKHQIDIDFDVQDKNNITIEIYNKKRTDTIVDAEGNILHDKKIEIKKIELDKIDIFADQEYFFKHTKYFEGTKKMDVAKPGLFLPEDRLVIEYPNVFWTHFLQTRFGNELSYQVNNNTELCYPILQELEKISHEYEY